MKTITKTMLLMLLALFVFSSNGFGATIDSDAGELDVFSSTHVAAADAQGPIGLSPKVELKYKTDGTDTTDTQWYAISSVHPGGNRVYGTAQDVNNVYFQDHETGTDLDTSLDKIPGSSLSASLWSTEGWSF